MTKQESKLAKKLDHQLQERVLPNKKNISRPKNEDKDIEVSIKVPTRIRQQRIQRAQSYSGDA
jgi:hypothetical protein